MAPRPKNPPPDRRQEILDAALRIFAAKGYSATTNADIARASGITPAALYYYFPSKEGLFRAAVAERRGQIQPAVALFQSGDLGAISPRELLPMILRNVISFLSEERTQAVLKIVTAEGPRDPTILEIWQEQVISAAGPLFPYLLHQMQQGRIRPMDPRLFFLALVGPLMATVITRDVLKIPILQDIGNEALIETLIESTLKALLTDER